MVVVVIATPEVVAMAADRVQRAALVAGAPGLVGQAVLAALLTVETELEKDLHTEVSYSDSTTGAVHVVHAKGRSAPALSHPRLELHAVDFTAMPSLPPVDDVYITLGTTISIARSQQAFRAVDYDAVMAVARAARDAGATRCGVVTAMGANAQSHIFYSRVKGEVERDIQTLGFTSLVLARPSLLIGDRKTLQQAPRRGESASTSLLRWLDPVIPANFRAQLAADVGHALVCAVRSAPAGLQVLCGQALRSRKK